MQCDYKAGWGTDEFEKNLAPRYMFPARWASADDRRMARQIITDNQALLDEMSRNRLVLQRNGYKLGDIMVRKSGPDGITFDVQLKSGTDGHNVPTGFD